MAYGKSRGKFIIMGEKQSVDTDAGRRVSVTTETHGNSLPEQSPTASATSANTQNFA